MNNKKNGYSEFMLYTIISIVVASISFITMIVLTRISSESFFGKINKFISASNVVMSMIFLGLDSAYIRFFYEPPNNTNNKQLAWKCMLPPLFLLFFVSIVLILFRNQQIISLFIGSKGLIFVSAFIVTVLSQFLNKFMTVFFRMTSKVLSFSLISIVFILLSKTVFIPTCLSGIGYSISIVIASILLFLFMLVFFCVNASRMLELSKSSFVYYKSVYRFAILASPIFVISYLNGYLPQIIISKSLGDDVLGIYTAALLFCSAVQVLSTGFTTFWSPYMYKNYKTKNDTIKNIHDVVLVGSVFALGLILLFSDFIYLFIGERFRSNQNILGMLLIYPIVLIIIETTSYGINIEKKNEISLIVYLISTCVNILLCIVLVSRYALNGIAIASMFSALIQLILLTYFGQKYYKSINNVFKTVFHILVLMLSAILFYVFYSQRIIFVIFEIIMLITCVFYNKQIIKWCFRFIQNVINERKRNAE